MPDDVQPRFTIDQIAAANTAIRIAAGLPPENFSFVRVVRMLADEIGQLRQTGWDDGAIAKLISEATGEPVDPTIVASGR